MSAGHHDWNLSLAVLQALFQHAVDRQNSEMFPSFDVESFGSQGHAPSGLTPTAQRCVESARIVYRFFMAAHRVGLLWFSIGGFVSLSPPRCDIMSKSPSSFGLHLESSSTKGRARLPAHSIGGDVRKGWKVAKDSWEKCPCGVKCAVGTGRILFGQVKSSALHVEEPKNR